MSGPVFSSNKSALCAFHFRRCFIHGKCSGHVHVNAVFRRLTPTVRDMSQTAAAAVPVGTECSCTLVVTNRYLHLSCRTPKCSHRMFTPGMSYHTPMNRSPTVVSTWSILGIAASNKLLSYCAALYILSRRQLHAHEATRKTKRRGTKKCSDMPCQTHLHLTHQTESPKKHLQVWCSPKRQPSYTMGSTAAATSELLYGRYSSIHGCQGCMHKEHVRLA